MELISYFDQQLKRAAFLGICQLMISILFILVLSYCTALGRGTYGKGNRGGMKNGVFLMEKLRNSEQLAYTNTKAIVTNSIN